MEHFIEKWLEDDESRFIFNKRMEYNTTGNYRVFEEIINRYVTEFADNIYYPEKEEKLIDDISDKNDIWIYGAGIRGKRLYEFLSNAEIKVKGIIDKKGKKAELAGIEVLKPEDADWNKIGCLIISMSDERAVQECADIAALNGMRQEDVILYSDYTIAALHDKQYFDSFITYQENEIFVDGGVLDLSTSLRFAKKCEENHISNYKILAFEPDKASYKKCIEVQKLHPEINIKLFNKGLYSFDTVVGFASSHDGSAHITRDIQGGGMRA